MPRNIDTIVVHCADTPPSMDVRAADIDRWHKERGWKGIGYHFVIRRDGVVEPGRPIDTPGAHVEGHNAYSIGICMAGGKGTPGDFTAQQWTALHALVSAFTRVYPDAVVLGHRDLNPGKACPTFDVKEWWARVRQTSVWKP